MRKDIPDGSTDGDEPVRQNLLLPPRQESPVSRCRILTESRRDRRLRDHSRSGRRLEGPRGVRTHRSRLPVLRGSDGATWGRPTHFRGERCRGGISLARLPCPRSERQNAPRPLRKRPQSHLGRARSAASPRSRMAGPRGPPARPTRRAPAIRSLPAPHREARSRSIRAIATSRFSRTIRSSHAGDSSISPARTLSSRAAALVTP